MTDDIKELGARRERTRLAYNNIAAQNSPNNPEDRVKESLRYQFAREAYYRADADFNAAISKLSLEQMAEFLNQEAGA